MQALKDEGEHVDDDFVQYSQPPERYAVAHRQMHAFGMYFRVRSAERGLVTRDSCVVASFTSQLRWGIRNGRPIERTDDYVGYIEEILELNYRNHCTTILVCNWIQGMRDVCFSHVQRDRYGFTIANFNHMDDNVHANSFAFPLHCQQVFFSDDPHRSRWKIVCRTEVRSRRGQMEVNQSIPSEIDVENDADFDGLQLEMLELELAREAASDGGMYIPPIAESLRQQEPEATE